MNGVNRHYFGAGYIYGNYAFKIIYYFLKNYFAGNIMLGKLYKLFDINKQNIIYIGSTTKDLKTRLKQHKYAFMSYLKGKYNYYSVFDIFLNANIIDNIDICLIEEIECQTEYELKKHEDFIISNLMTRDKGILIVNLNKPINENKYDLNKSYRDQYKVGKKSKILIKCPCCNKKIQISIKPNSCRNFIDSLEYTESE